MFRLSLEAPVTPRVEWPKKEKGWGKGWRPPCVSPAGAASLPPRGTGRLAAGDGSAGSRERSRARSGGLGGFSLAGGRRAAEPGMARSVLAAAEAGCRARRGEDDAAGAGSHACSDNHRRWGGCEGPAAGKGCTHVHRARRAQQQLWCGPRAVPARPRCPGLWRGAGSRQHVHVHRPLLSTPAGPLEKRCLCSQAVRTINVCVRYRYRLAPIPAY